MGIKLKLEEQFEAPVKIVFGDGSTAEVTGIYREVSDEEMERLKSDLLTGKINNADIVRDYLIDQRGIDADGETFDSLKTVILSRPRFVTPFSAAFMSGAHGSAEKNSGRSRRR
jgi:hypothetical protein